MKSEIFEGEGYRVEVFASGECKVIADTTFVCRDKDTAINYLKQKNEKNHNEVYERIISVMS